MTTCFDELSDVVRENIARALRIRRIRRGFEVGEYGFQTIINDPKTRKAHVVGTVVLKVDGNQREIKWDTFYPSNIKCSRDDPKPLRKSGLGSYAHLLTLLTMSEMLEDPWSYNVVSNPGASEERQRQLKVVGLERVTPLGRSICTLVHYAERKGIKVTGVNEVNGFYGLEQTQ